MMKNVINSRFFKTAVTVLLFSVGSICVLTAQNVAINTSGNTAYTSAILDLSNQNTAGTVGFLPPYVNLNLPLTGFQLSGTASQSNGIIIYATGAGTAPAGLYCWNNASGTWVAMGLAGWNITGNTGITASTSAIGTLANNNFIGTTNASDFVMAANGYERLRIANSTGNIGISNINPTTLLQVGNGGSTGKLSVYTADDSWGEFQIGNPTVNAEASITFISGVTAFGNNPASASGTSNIWNIGAGNAFSGGNKFGIGNDAYGGTMVTWTSAGLMGILQTSPNQALEIGGTGNTERIDGLATGNTFNAAPAAATTYMMYANAAGDLYSIPAGTTGYVLSQSATGPQWASLASLSAGTVTSFSSGTLSPLFTTSVATATTTPALSFTISNAAAYTILGNNTNASAAPAYFTPTLASALFQNQGTTTTVLHGNAAGNPSWGAVNLTTDVTGILPIANGGTNNNAAPTAGGAAYGTGTTYAVTAAGTTGQVLTSAGAAAPTWSNPVTSNTLENYTNANVTLAIIGTWQQTGATISLTAGTWSVTSETTLSYTSGAAGAYDFEVYLGTAATAYTSGQSSLSIPNGQKGSITISLSKIITVAATTSIFTYFNSNTEKETCETSLTLNSKTANTATGIHAVRLN